MLGSSELRAEDQLGINVGERKKVRISPGNLIFYAKHPKILEFLWHLLGL